MSRASWIYILMAVAFVAGLWAILSIGARLEAPADLAGRYELIPLDERNATPSHMTVDQSGRHFRLRLGKHEQHHMQLVEQRRQEHADGQRLFMKLAGDGAIAEFLGPVAGNVLELRLTQGGQTRAWTALWAERTYGRSGDDSVALTHAP